MSTKVLYTNLGRSPRAHDILRQFMAENGIGVCAIAEPANVSESSTYYLSENKLAGVLVNSDIISRGISLVYRGNFTVSVRCYNFIITACYISPNANFSSFISFVDELTLITSQHRGNLLVCGDFNLRDLLRSTHLT